MLNTASSQRSSDCSEAIPSPCDPFAVACRLQREELGLSQQQAAERAGMCVEQWESIERGAWMPFEVPELRAIARALDADVVNVFMLAVFEPLPKNL
jgi:transcriptional regulator with XRE-family HTH domain